MKRIIRVMIVLLLLTGAARAEQEIPVRSVDATSWLVSQKDPAKFVPDRMTDGDEGTSFQFSARKTPLGKEYVVFRFSQPEVLDEVWIKNGDRDTSDGLDRYLRNARVRQLTADFEYGGSGSYTDGMILCLPDDRAEWTKFSLGRHEGVTAVRFLITKLYEGAKYPDDAAISEVRFVTRDGAGAQARTLPVRYADATSWIVKDNGTADYGPGQMTDGRENTSFQFSTLETPLGSEYLYFGLDTPSDVDALWIKNGFWKINGPNRDQYVRNSRIRTMTVDFRHTGLSGYSDPVTVTLPDDSSRKDWTRVTFERRSDVEEVRLRVQSVYRGSAYPTDVGVTEVALVKAEEGTAARTPAAGPGAASGSSFEEFVLNSGYLLSGQAFYDENDLLLTLWDMDRDGSPELLFFNGGADERTAATYVYQETGQEVRFAGSIALGDIYPAETLMTMENTGVLYGDSYSFSTGRETFYTYSLRGGQTAAAEAELIYETGYLHWYDLPFIRSKGWDVFASAPRELDVLDVAVTFDRERYAAGEPLTATLRIRNGTPPYRVSCLWIETDGWDQETILEEDNVETQDGTAQIRFFVPEGTKHRLDFVYTVTDLYGTSSSAGEDYCTIESGGN